MPMGGCSHIVISAINSFAPTIKLIPPWAGVWRQPGGGFQNVISLESSPSPPLCGPPLRGRGIQVGFTRNKICFLASMIKVLLY